MFDDLAKSIKAALYERIASPLLRSFIISWGIWNYRLIVVLLDKIPAAEKFKFIDSQLYPDQFHFFEFHLLGPLATALVFIFVYPFPARRVYKFWQTRQKELAEDKQKIEDETPITVEQSRQLKRELADWQTKYQADIEKRDQTIKSLRELLDTERERVTSSTTPAEKLYPNQGLHILDNQGNLTPIAYEVIEAIGKFEESEEPAPESEIIGTLGIHHGGKVAIKLYVDELFGQQYIGRNYLNKLQDYALTLEHKGRAALLEKHKPAESKT